MAKLSDYQDQRVQLIGLNMTLADGVRRDVWVVYYNGDYAVAAFGELDVMFFNATPNGYFWNSSIASAYESRRVAQADFNKWYHAGVTKELG